jgi:hypothetical protein
MARSAAYLDYLERYRQAVALLLATRNSSDPVLAGAGAKGAIVLAAAALERFMNDAVRQACQRLTVLNYAELSPGQQSYLCAQIARRIGVFGDDRGDYRNFNEQRRSALRNAVGECMAAFNDPSTWQHISEFGLFLDGAAAPAKIASILRDFAPDGPDVYIPLDERGSGRATALRLLSQLVDARHDAAHAKSMSVPSPSDAQSWIANSFWIARLVEFFLVGASPIALEV